MRERLISILEKANEVRIKSLNQSVDLVEEVLLVDSIDDNLDLKAKALCQLSLYYMVLGDNDKSLNYGNESIELYKKLDDERGIADAKYCIAGVYYKTDNYHIGLVFLIDALNIYKKYDDYYNISRCEKSIGTIYEYSGDQKSAIKSYIRAVEYAQKIGNLNLESNAYNNLSGLYIKQGYIDLAKDTILKSVELKIQTGDTRGMAFAIYGRAKVNMDLKKYEIAKADFMESITIHTEMGEKLGLAMCYHKLAKLYMEVNDLNQAKAFLVKALELSKAYKISVVKLKCYYLFYKIYKQEDNKLAALEYLELYINFKETVLNTQTLRVIDSYDVLVQMKTMQKEAAFLREKAEMMEKTSRAEEEARVRQEFLSSMSHEIRTPLNAITTIASLLGERINEEDKKLIDSLNFSSHHLMRLINDILDFSKLDVEKMELNLYPTAICPFLEKSLEVYEFQSKEKSLDFSFKTNISPTQSYHLDSTKINQIIGNLVSNAVKFTEVGKIELEVTLLESDEEFDRVLFSISDTGEGINEKDQAKIFDSFYQIKNSITRKAGGTGLGLAIVKKLVQLHGSTIKIESEPEKGTRFYFELKLKKADSIIPKTQDRATVSLEGIKVLLAEDNQINAMIAMRLLSKWGIVTTHVVNGELAVKKAQAEAFDCILMDIHMPIMDGFEATEQIRKSEGLNNQTPVYGLTADISANENKEYNSLFNDFLLKPIEIEKLKAALSSVRG